MKRIAKAVPLMVFLLSTAMLFAGGDKEEGAAEAKGPVTVTFMATESGLPSDSIEHFNANHPNIKLVRVERDYTKWMADAMAGTAADLVQVGIGTDAAYYASRGLLLDITGYIENSDVIKMDDIDMKGSESYKWNGEEYGKGKWYGLPFDYNNIGCVTYNKMLFAEAGVPNLSPDKPVTYPELRKIAEKLTAKDANGDVVIWGTDFTVQWIKFLVSDMATADDVSFYTDDTLSEMNDTNKLNEKWLYFARLIKDDIAGNINNPVPGWAGAAFQSDRIGLVQLGYWYGDQLKANEGYAEKYGWAPTPKLNENAPHVTNNLGATGVSIYSQSKNPEEAFTVLEWRVGGWEGKRRAANGWGIPPLYSLQKLSPRDEAYDRERLQVAMYDIEHMVPWQATPLITSDMWNGSWSKYIDDLVEGKISEEEFIDKYYANVDELLEIGKEELGY